MTSIVTILYGLYFVLVGAHGNAEEFLALIVQEKQFVYWLVAMLIIAGLWESPVATNLAKPLAALIVLGFLLSNKNYETIIQHFDAIMAGTAPTTVG